MLTLEQLKEMKPGIFASGVTDVEDYWDASKTMRVAWVASRGGIHDWAIYYKLETEWWDNEMIRDMGDKMRNEASIRKCIDCDDDAFAMYRY